MFIKVLFNDCIHIAVFAGITRVFRDLTFPTQRDRFTVEYSLLRGRLSYTDRTARRLVVKSLRLYVCGKTLP